MDNITAVSETAKGEEDGAIAADVASYKMYYLIAKDTTPLKAEAAQTLRTGLTQLREYISGGKATTPKKAEALQAAFQALQNARIENPDLYEAYLYEGIAL